MKLSVAGLGAWGPGFNDIESLWALLNAPPREALPPTATPKPDLIPARERRRAPLLARLAVEVSSQACNNAGLDAAGLACVFASGVGDTVITDYMCRTLAGESLQLSPTRFHNSVHNAAAGYWSISTGCHEPANSVSAFQYTAAAGLLEAATQCVSENRPVLLTAFDAPGPGPIDRVNHVSEAFAAAIILLPVSDDAHMALSVTPQYGAWPACPAPALQSLYETNPAARLLALLHGLNGNQGRQLTMPLGDGCSLNIVLGERAAAA